MNGASLWTPPAPTGIAAGGALSTAPALTFAEGVLPVPRPLPLSFVRDGLGDTSVAHLPSELQAVTVSIYKDLVMAAREVGPAYVFRRTSEIKRQGILLSFKKLTFSWSDWLKRSEVEIVKE